MFLFISIKSSFLYGGNIYLLNIIQQVLSKLINVNTLSFAIKIMIAMIIILIIAIDAIKNRKDF